MTLAELAQQEIHCKIAVNISSKDLLQDELVDSLELLLKRHKVQPSQLVLELKESALVAEPAKAMRMLKTSGATWRRAGAGRFWHRIFVAGLFA